ncbi:MAG: hypothetical protein AABM29_05800 [Actinomycetota bacterium]
MAAEIAPASSGQTTIFDLGGAALDASPAKRTQFLDEAKELGTDTVRVLISWRNIAPSPGSSDKPSFDATDPAAYPGANWGALDEIVRGTTQRGMTLLLTPTSPIPDWASASGESMFANPDADEFGKFVQALGTRYSGTFSPPPGSPVDPPVPLLPRISAWSVYNEANLTLFLRPQFKGGKSVAGKLYRSLFLAAQRALQNTGHGNDDILIGETSPGPGRKGTDPVTFVRGVFCLNRNFQRKGNCEPINATGWAQHPYDPFNPPYERTEGLINIASIGQLIRALNRAAASGAATRRLPIFVTEYGIESVPDRKYGVSQLRQAEYIGISEYLMYRNPRIYSFGQYLMQDDKGADQTNFQTGLRFASGAAKVAYKAFPITLVAQRRSERDRTVTIWGHVRPANGSVKVTVDFKPGGKKTVQTNGNGYFRFNTPFRQARKYSASAELPDGRNLQGPAQRVYVFK